MYNGNPEAHITVRKSRVKNYSGTYYLSSGIEFEIELYNPTQDKISAQLTINGAPESHSLVLNPGQRVFLERYMADDKKFKFDTYFVDGSSQTKQAIKDNGGIQVQFYREVKHQPAINISYPLVFRSPNYYPIQGDPYWYDYSKTTGARPSYPTFTTSSFNSHVDNIKSNSYNSGIGTDSVDMSMGASNCYFSSDVKSFNADQYKTKSVLRKMSMESENKSESIETGRIEKGAKSSQSFTTVYDSFELYSFHSITLKLLPLSQEPAQHVTVYCTSCGRKKREKENFCPKCGTNLQL